MRYAARDDDLAVPSPTFLLHNTYSGFLRACPAPLATGDSDAGTDPRRSSAPVATEGPAGDLAHAGAPVATDDSDDDVIEVPVHHLDLYRLESGETGVARLGVPALCRSGVTLIEWASRLPAPPPQAVTVTFTVLDSVRCHYTDERQKPHIHLCCTSCCRRSAVDCTAAQARAAAALLSSSGRAACRRRRRRRSPSRSRCSTPCAAITTISTHLVQNTRLSVPDNRTTHSLDCGYTAMASCSTADTMPRQCPFAL